MNHKNITMKHEERQVKDKELIKSMLDQCPVCTLAMHDEPYPYEVPLNFGYEWDEQLILYMHMASEGYKMELLKKNPYVSCNAYGFVDRSIWGKYRGEHQDYRSVTVFGKAEFITAEQPELFLKALNHLQDHYKREHIQKAPKTDKLVVIRLAADAVTAKSMYPLQDVREAYMPSNAELDQAMNENKKDRGGEL